MCHVGLDGGRRGESSCFVKHGSPVPIDKNNNDNNQQKDFRCEMEIMSPSSSNPSTPATHDGFYLRQTSLLFSDSLEDLTNLRSQLYSAADYFEFTYTNEECKQIVADTLKDYAIKALVNTVDHLGSASYKVDRLFNDNTDEVVEADLRVSCIEQRLATFQECIDLAGFSQQSLVIATPKYHKRYVLPIGESMPESGDHAVVHVPESHTDGDELRSQTFQDAIRSTIVERTSSFRRGRSRSMSSSPQSARCPTLPETFARSGSISNRPTLPEFPPGIAQRFPAEIRKSASVHLNRGGGGDGEGKELVKNSSKTKGFLMSLLKKHKVKKDEMLYTYLDEY